MADFSTAHVTLQDISQMAWAADLFRRNEKHLNIWHYDEGFFVYCGGEAESGGFQSEFRFSDHLMNLLRLGAKNDCAYINIDSDGTEYDELERVDWDEAEFGKFYQNCIYHGLGALKDQDWIASVVGDLIALGVNTVFLVSWLQGDHFAVTALSFHDPLGTSMETNPLTVDHTIKAIRWLVLAALGTNRQWNGTKVEVGLTTTDREASIICSSEGLDLTLKFTNQMEVTLDGISKLIRRK